MMKRHYKLFLLGACAAIAVSGHAEAQTGSTTGETASPAPGESGAGATSAATVDDIIVTAQRRNESLSRSPVSVSVVSSDVMAKAQIVTENDLRAATPGLQIRNGSNSNQINYSLRGQSQDPFSNVRPGVLPYFNEVQIGGQGGASAFYDLQSVQVLKGPQGTLFGRSATGGAVLFTSAKPTDELGGYISALYGNYDAAKVEGAINVPLDGDRLMARVAGFYRERDGFQFNLFDGEKVGDQKQYGGRFSLTAQPTDTVRNELVVDYFQSNSENTASVLSGLVPFTGVGAPFIPLELLYSGTATPIAAITGQCTLQGFAGFPGACPPVDPSVAAFYNGYFSDPSHPANGLRGQLEEQQARGPFIINSDSENLFRAKNVILSNATSVDLSDTLQLKNIVGFTRIKSLVSQEADGTPYSIASSSVTSASSAVRGQGLASDTRQFSNELQLIGTSSDDRLTYVLGGYFSDERSTTSQQSCFFDLVFGGLCQTNNFAIKNKTYAGYAQGTYKLNDAGLSATIGARYTSEKVGIDVLPGDTNRQALGPTPPPGFTYNQSDTYKRLSWTLGLQNQISSSTFLYVATRRAYKSGGFNGLVQPKIGGGDVAGNQYRAERITDVEAGAKFNGWLGTMPARANLALFHSWIDDSQRVAFTVVNGGPAGVTVNVPSGKTYGAEFDGQVSPSSWLTLGVVANYTKATFGADPVAVNGQSQVFDQVPDTPRFSGSAYADLTIPLGGNLSLLAHGDVYRQSKTFTSPRSANNLGGVIDAYTVANFRLGVEDEEAGWSLIGNLKNAFNKRYYAGGVATAEIYQINLLTPAEPRTVTVEARFKF